MEYILKYFSDLSAVQRAHFEQLGPMYREWNQKVNVVSRKDIDNLYLHHLLHSLAIAKVIRFRPGAHLLDLGTGGGFPGIPLAILQPEVRFSLIDGTRKKVMVARDIIERLELRNVTAQHIRAEELRQQFDFVVTRAVASLDKLVGWSARLIKKEHQHALPNGLFALKGGAIREETRALPRGSYVEVFPISDYFEESYFAEKYLVYVQA